MLSRRRFLGLCGSAGVCAGTRLLDAQPQDRLSTQTSGRHLVTRKTRVAIEGGLKFLAGRQQKDGSFGSPGGFRQNVGVTSLAAMSFLAAGHSPGRGAYGSQVASALNFVLSKSTQSGFIVAEGSKSHGPMYGHGFATLFLSEIYGMSGWKPGSEPHQNLRRKLKNAIALIVNSQNREGPNAGGWRYDANSKDADVSVTVCQLMALRAARNAGFFVPKDAAELAVKYVTGCQNRDGGFRYKRTRREQSEFSRSAAAVVALNSAGIYSGPVIEKSLRYLNRFRPDGRVSKVASHYFYGHYYAVQAFWHAGGDQWLKWYPAIRDELVGNQRSDGGWTDRPICQEYGTAMALLILQMPYNFLPIFQR